MNTTKNGDMAEQSVLIEALKRGYSVCMPITTSSAYDLVFDVDSTLLKIQVKKAWLDKGSGNYVCDNRRTKTNRRQMKRDRYTIDDFDFAIIFIEEIHVFYVMPVDVFISFGSSIQFVETERRQRPPRSAKFREGWHLLEQYARAPIGETQSVSSVKFGETFSNGNPEPSLFDDRKV